MAPFLCTTNFILEICPIIKNDLQLKTQKFYTHIFAILSILFTVLFTSCTTDLKDDDNISVSTSNITISLSENPENGTVIGAVPFSFIGGNGVTFSLIDEIPEGAVSVNAVTGEVIVANNQLFDFETNPRILALVEVRNGEFAINSSVTINVLDVNEGIFIGDVTLKTQDEINNFATNNYTEIAGFLQIGEQNIPNNSITDLSPLQGLVSVGNLVVIENTALTSLNGLNNLTGTILAIDIVKNENLTDISALSNLTSVTSQLQIFGCGLLQNLSGLQNISTIGGKLIVSNNNSLTTLEGLNGLNSVTAEYTVLNNGMLTNFCATQNVFTNGFTGTYSVSGNSFNPTQADLVAGNCSN